MPRSEPVQEAAWRRHAAALAYLVLVLLVAAFVAYSYVTTEDPNFAGIWLVLVTAPLGMFALVYLPAGVPLVPALIAAGAVQALVIDRLAARARTRASRTAR